MAKFEAEVDPNNSLPADERTRRARSLFRAHMTRLARKSADARRKDP